MEGSGNGLYFICCIQGFWIREAFFPLSLDLIIKTLLLKASVCLMTYIFRS